MLPQGHTYLSRSTRDTSPAAARGSAPAGEGLGKCGPGCSGTSCLMARAQPLQNPSPRSHFHSRVQDRAARRPGRVGHYQLRLLMVALSSGDIRPAHVSMSVPPAHQPGATVPMSSEEGKCEQRQGSMGLSKSQHSARSQNPAARGQAQCLFAVQIQLDRLLSPRASVSSSPRWDSNTWLRG